MPRRDLRQLAAIEESPADHLGLEPVLVGRAPSLYGGRMPRLAALVVSVAALAAALAQPRLAEA
jgi:hypothetical protein